MIPYPDRIHFAIGFPFVPSSVIEVWEQLTRHLKEACSLPRQFEVHQTAGHAERFKSEEDLKLSPSDVAALIAERNLDGFWVNSGYSARSVGFSLLHAKDAGPQSELRCRIEKNAQAPDDWGALITSLMNRFPSIGAWQWRQYYQSWQWNCRVDLGYEQIFGPIPPGFRRTHEASIDGIGPGRTLLDVSLNPGRPKTLLPMVSFYPTAEMWLGPHFWQYAKCTKEEALAADFFIEKRDTPHYLYLKCWPHAFTRPDGEQGHMQQRLWKLFFHEDCEWPPGSGTICDEPRYGPPELMPDCRQPEVRKP
ncbi:hypothetical protein [Roseimicrobium sp. ORNL1]|uniref:hypothetical protein n=1 Tax=Roseimicrobium sp. ORNL1 TaxID=2711231 RepID=UPI0013E1CFAA|nr:hypothetical protein [Roseimicrobium sp. ORNL1]QIF04733.1 hypothetical protein G5S37_25435 [Roseimicrobium sp. ORNL1]